MRNPGGYAVWSYDDGRRREADSFTCGHCNRIVIVPPRADPADLGGLCKQCMALTCPRCTAQRTSARRSSSSSTGRKPAPACTGRWGSRAMAWNERYLRDDAAGGGDGTTDTNSGANGAWTLAEAVANEAAGMRINVRGAGSAFPMAATTRTLAAVGTTTAPIWWRGFNTTPGDIDTDNTLTKPEFTGTTGRLVISGAHHIVTNLRVTITGAAAQAAIGMSAAPGLLDRVRAENQQANAAASAIAITGTGGVATRCYAKATTTATRSFQIGSSASVSGCYVEGGISGIDVTAGAAVVRGNLVVGATTNGITCASTTVSSFLANTIYNCGTNGFNFTSVTIRNTVEDNLIHTVTNGINNTSGADTNFIRAHSNVFYAVTNETVGLGDSPVLGSLTESADPFTTTGSLILTSTAVSRRSAIPARLKTRR